MPDLKTYFKAKLIKIMWCWHRDGHRNQLNKNKGPEVNPYFWPFIFNKSGKTSRERIVIFNKQFWDKWISTCKANTFRPLQHTTQTN